MDSTSQKVYYYKRKKTGVTMKSLITFLFFFILIPVNSIAQDSTKTVKDWEYYDNLTVEHYSSGDYESALVAAKNAAIEAEKEFGKNDLNYTMSINNVAMLSEILGNYEDAEKLYKEALELMEPLVGREDIEFAYTLENFGMLYRAMGKYDEAAPLFKESLKTLRNILGSESPDFALSLNNSGSLYLAWGAYATAEQYFKAAEEILEDAGEDYLFDYMAVLGNLAHLYERMGRYSEEEALTNQVLELYQKELGEEHPYYVNTLNNLAALYVTLGKYTEAEGLYKKVIEGNKSIYGDKHSKVATAYLNLAELYKLLGRYDGAESLILRAMNIRESQLGKEHADFAMALNQLALLYYQLELYNDAEEMYKEALDIWSSQEELGENHPEYAVTLNNLAALHAQLGNYKEAETMFNRALVLLERTLGKEHPKYANALKNAGQFQELQGKYQEAIEYYKSAREIHEEQFHSAHPSLGEDIVNLARIHSGEKQYDQAGEYLRDMLRNYRRQITTYFPGMSEKEKAVFYNTLKTDYNIFYSFVIERYGEEPDLLSEMYDNRLFTKGLLINAQKKVMRSIKESGDSVLISLYEDWISTREYLAKLYSMTRYELSQQNTNVDSLENYMNDLEKELSLRSGSFSKEFGEKEITWERIKQSLKEDEAAVEMIRFRYFDKELTDSVLYAALIVTSKTEDNPDIVLLRDGNYLEGKLVDNYREKIMSQENDTLSYKYFWEPLETTLEGIKKIFVSPDGVYNNINIETLFTPEKEYLFEKYDIHIVTNTKDLLVSLNEATQDETENLAVLLGYPNYTLTEEKQAELAIDVRSGKLRTLTRGGVIETDTDFESDESTERSDLRTLKIVQDTTAKKMTLSKLPGTRVEVEEIMNITNQNNWIVESYLDDTALEEVVKETVNPTLLHIATHGFFLQDTETAKSVSFGIASIRSQTNPLLRSGLFLAGATRYLALEATDSANLKTENGILTAYEAMNLKLDQTELVVLSACETGLGEVENGEGVYGLQRSLLVAGAKSVIMSLWQVDDNATQELMRDFYQEWMRTGNKQEAFRVAKSMVKEQYEKPFYWGAFILVE